MISLQGMDPSFTRMIKLDILVSLCIDPTAIDAVLTELRTYVRHNDKTFACAAIHAVGKITELARVVYDRRAHTAGLDAASARENANVIALNCLSGLVTLSEYSKNEKVVGECAETMQRILAQLWSCNGCVSSKHSNGMGLPATNDPARVQESALKRLLLILVRAISRVEVNGDEEGTEQNQLEMRAVCVPDSAVSSILWVIGEWFIMSETMSSPWSLDKSKKANIRLEILRLLAKSFSEVNPQMKLQAVHLASKVLFMLKANQQLSVDTTIQECAICEFILAMGRVDVLQDIRDRSRYESNVLHMSIGLSHDTSALQSLPGNAVSISVENARSMLLHGKPTASSLPLDGKEFGSVKNETDLFRFGTLSSIVGHRTGGSNMSLPKWADADSPSSLRDPMAPKPDEIIGEGGLDSGGLYSSSSEEDSSSDDDSSSSSSESSSDDSDDSDDDSSDSESDDSSDDDDDNEKLDAGNNGVFGSNALGVKPLIPIPTQEPEALLPSLMNDIARDSSSSSDDDSDSDDSDESSDDEDANIHALAKPSVGTLFDMEAAANPSQFPMQYSKQTSDTSSTVAAGLEDLVMTPLVMDKQDTAQPSNIDNESGLWKDFVRPELGGGLFVKARFLHGRSRAREAKVIGLDPTNPSTVCLQVHIENM